MKSWSLQFKFAVYSATLALVALIVAGAVLLPFLYYYQLNELDDQLTENAQELFRDLKNFKDAPKDPRKPVSYKIIPVALRLRYVELEGPEGQTLHRSGNLGKVDLSSEKVGARTLIVGEDREARIVTMKEPDGVRVLHIGTTLGRIEKMQEDVKFALLVILPSVGIIVFMGGWLLGKRALRPVAELTKAAESISAENPEERLPMPASKDELARLTEVLNRSFDRLQRSYQAAARFSADASHQLKTPIAVLRMGLESLRSGGRIQGDDAEEVASMLQQTRRLTALIGDLLLLAQADAGRLNLAPANLDLVPLLAEGLDDLSVLAEVRGLKVDSQLPAELHALADSRRVSLILQNLIENAAKYSPAGGTILLAATELETTVEVSVANTGSPIPIEQQEPIFERFNRGSVGENVRGHGLGLNIARELARAHGGELFLKRSDAEWTEFTLRLPKASAAQGS